MKTDNAPKNPAMELARSTRHHDSSNELPSDEVTSEASHRDGPASEASRCDDLARSTRHENSSDESPCDALTSEASHSNGPAREASRCDDLARSRRHHDSSDESPCDALTSEASHRDEPASEASRCDETGAAAAPPQFVRRIAVDHRETPSGVPTALATHPNVEISICLLPLGDYRVNDTLIVERKTLTDFTRSVRNGRLFAQASKLARVKSARPCLILEGTRINHWSAALPRSAFQGALITVTLVFGLPVLRSSNPEETAALILYAADQLQRRTIKPPTRYGYQPKGLTRQQSYLLQAIPEIGPLRAERLLDAFGSPAGVANATIEALQSAEGIGPSAATKIHHVFHGE